MAKVQNIAGITPNLPFTEYDFYDLYRETFENTELGRIKRLLPLHEMAENLGLVRKSMSLFGIHTANVVQLAERIAERQQVVAA